MSIARYLAKLASGVSSDGVLPASKGGTGNTSGGGSGGASVTTSATAPSNPTSGALWLDSESGDLYIYAGGSWILNADGSGGGSGGLSANVFFENSQSLSTSYTITEGKSAMSTGPINIEDGVVVTIPSGSKWVIL